MAKTTNKTEHNKKGDQKRTAEAKKRFLAAMEKSLGVVTTACQMTGTGRTTYYEWMEKDPDFAKDIAGIEEIVLDFAESKLHKQVESGNTVATIFLLKTKGKKRGYIERQELDHSGSMNVTWEETKTYEKPNKNNQ